MSDLELLRIGSETLWATDDRGRIEGRDLVIGSSALGNTVAVGSAVPADLAELLEAAVNAAPVDLNLPPTVLEQCRQLLANTLGPVELTTSSGPSYLIPETISFEPSVALVRSDTRGAPSLRAANPGNWEPDEWAQLLDGQLGPWVSRRVDPTGVSRPGTCRGGHRRVGCAYAANRPTPVLQYRPGERVFAAGGGASQTAPDRLVVATCRIQIVTTCHILAAR